MTRLTEALDINLQIYKEQLPASTRLFFAAFHLLSDSRRLDEKGRGLTLPSEIQTTPMEPMLTAALIHFGREGEDFQKAVIAQMYWMYLRFSDKEVSHQSETPPQSILVQELLYIARQNEQKDADHHQTHGIYMSLIAWAKSVRETRSSSQLELLPTRTFEEQLLQYLQIRKDYVSAQELTQFLWGNTNPGTILKLRKMISRLMKKGKNIANAYGRGWMLSE